MQSRPEQRVLHRSNLYRGCSVLPMENFLQCLCENNLQALVVEGSATEKELTEAWVIILAEYYELRGETSEQWQLSRDVLRLQNHLFLLDQCVEFLKIRWSDSIAESIRSLGYPFNPVDHTNYGTELNRVINKAKTKFIVLQQLIKQLADQVKKFDDKKPSRDYFDQMLIHIEEMQKVSYSMESLTVQKYIQLEKKYFQYVEQLKARVAKHGRTH